MQHVYPISVTKPLVEHASPEQLIAYCARVSSGKQEAEKMQDTEKLLRYCFEHGHYSIFEMASMCVAIDTTLAIAPQFLRHKSFSFQQFSLRYSKAHSVELYRARKQSTTNKQSSENFPEQDCMNNKFQVMQQNVTETGLRLYEEALDMGIARESARMLLPMTTKTTFYMNGTVRSWITYFKQRLTPETQKEHREIAEEIFEYFREYFPTIAKLVV